MTVCNNCGNTRNPTNASRCQVCGNALPSSSALTKTTSAQSKSPALLDIQGKRYSLSIAGETYIGSRGCAIILADPKVLPRHVRIFTQQGQFYVEDLEGGVTLNGKPIVGQTVLCPNDVLIIGNSQLRVDIAPVSSIVPFLSSTPSAPSAVPHKPSPPPGGSTVTVLHPSSTSSITGPGGKLPTLEGNIMHIDGPHMEEPDYSVGTVIAKTIGQILLFPLILWKPGFSPLLYRNDQHKQTPARYLRVKDDNGQTFVVKMKGEIYRGMVSQGDRIAVWGKWDGGTLIMDYGYNITINSVVSLKKIT